ncbi:MAG: UDP-N-acetylmuramate--L-alanine ligase [Flavobacteriales bacterium]|mgnify:CR=1 FL=1|nr:UDP-N-acetylmuramate--L-alanine ligase [Flavobacteriales bacterium]|tara:strand:+ start:7063 stop:8436 length:1374 start_codon:yes stop_codon:yes gene_type:complete
MNLNQYKNMYFVGIGGIGMSALARYFNFRNVNIFGYDKNRSNLCLDLESENININYSDNIDLIPSEVKENKKETLVIYTPAIPKINQQFSYFKYNRYKILKRAELLAKVTEEHFTIAVAGTHGKTTTSSILAHILYNSDVDCTAFLGGICSNYNSNLLLGSTNSLVVVEADEFDRSFLTLSPDIAVITSIALDHLDIYKNKENLKIAFAEFINNIKSGGTLFLEESIDTTIIERDDISVLKYSTSTITDVSSKNIFIEDEIMHFDVLFKDEIVTDFKLKMGGEYNVSNALAAITISKKLNVSNDNIVKSINSFEGIERRFETHISNNEVVFIDDYAHHPEEVEKSILAVRNMYSDREITVIFQPHLYSRTKDFMEEFATSLSLSDKLILLEIYAARECKIEGVTSDILLQKCKVKDKKLCTKKEVLSLIEKNEVDVLLTLGAGDISTIIKPLKDKLL